MGKKGEEGRKGKVKRERRGVGEGGEERKDAELGVGRGANANNLKKDDHRMKKKKARRGGRQKENTKSRGGKLARQAGRRGTAVRGAETRLVMREGAEKR